ncbi:MAG: Asp-tRNA(Asn)/Glu-tRNA(Gln) amidotransferase subunit GatC [Patescibacteria group bacterium]|nr:Asp-tRNA(Asn)/Glu-tRNA(Gln) amidotransferase subunit GatC [Patescibacteria group bacterium]
MNMISRSDIENLAALSRLSLTEAELKSLEKDLGAILAYVGEIQQGRVDAPEEILSVHTVMREDVPGVTVGGSPEALLAQAPRHEEEYIVVRKIIQRDE